MKTNVTPTICSYCDRRVWPWQRSGWIVGMARWHSRCRRIAARLGSTPSTPEARDD